MLPSDLWIGTDPLAIALLLARILLAAVFAFAGTAKLFNPAEFRRAIVAFGVPAPWVRAIGVLLPAGELVVAGLLLPASTGWWGATGALVLLLVFITAITINLVQGRTPDCQCFGQVRSQPIGRGTLARNTLLACCAGLNVWAGRSYANRSAIDWLPAATHLPTFALVVFAGLLLALTAAGILLAQLFRQHGRLLLRMDHVEQWLAMSGGPQRGSEPQPQGLAIGTPAPAFTLPTLSGTTSGLDALLRGSKALLLIFSSPACQPCTSLLPDIRRWQGDATESMRVAVVSGGTEQANRAMTEEYTLRDVLLQKEREIAELYGVQGTPGAVLIRADGTIGSLVAMGGAAIASLFAVETASLVMGAALEKPTPSAS